MSKKLNWFDVAKLKEKSITFNKNDCSEGVKAGMEFVTDSYDYFEKTKYVDTSSGRYDADKVSYNNLITYIKKYQELTNEDKHDMLYHIRENMSHDIYRMFDIIKYYDIND